MTIIIMRGMPGSGKTTEARRWASLSSDHTIVSADDYMFAGGQPFEHTRLERCHEQCQTDFEAALVAGKALVIADNTNTKFSDIVPYVELAERHRRDFIVLQIHITPKLAFERNRHGVPLETLQLLGRRLWSERMPSTWNVWNKGMPWRPNEFKGERGKSQLRHLWVPNTIGEICPKCKLVRVPLGRTRKPRVGAKVVKELPSYSYYINGGVVGEGLSQQPDCK